MSCMQFRIGTDLRRRLELIFTVFAMFEQLLKREVKNKQDISNINMTESGVLLGNVGGHNFGPNFNSKNKTQRMTQPTPKLGMPRNHPNVHVIYEDDNLLEHFYNDHYMSEYVKFDFLP